MSAARHTQRGDALSRAGQDPATPVLPPALLPPPTAVAREGSGKKSGMKKEN